MEFHNNAQYVGIWQIRFTKSMDRVQVSHTSRRQHTLDTRCALHNAHSYTAQTYCKYTHTAYTLPTVCTHDTHTHNPEISEGDVPPKTVKTITKRLN